MVIVNGGDKIVRAFPYELKIVYTFIINMSRHNLCLSGHLKICSDIPGHVQTICLHYFELCLHTCIIHSLSQVAISSFYS